MAEFESLVVSTWDDFPWNGPLAMAGEHGKRHARHPHQPEAVSDWLNPFSLGTMSPSAYIDNLA